MRSQLALAALWFGLALASSLSMAFFSIAGAGWPTFLTYVMGAFAAIMGLRCLRAAHPEPEEDQE